MITDSFKSNILNIYGTKGKIWLTELPNIVEKNAERFGLSKLKPIVNLSYNYILSGLMSDTPIILKLSFNDKDLKLEELALKCFEGFGAVKIIKADKGLLILAQANPGISLKGYFPNRDDEAIKITCNLIKKLHQAPIPEKHNFPHLKDLVKVLYDKQNLFATDCNHYLQKAKNLSNQILTTATSYVLLHGDLHHDNILQNGNDWLMIDPKGRIGDPAYEVVGFINDPMPELIMFKNAPQIIQNRIQVFANTLNISPTRISKWCFVKSVMCWIWALEDRCDSTYWQRMAAIFDALT